MRPVLEALRRERLARRWLPRNLRYYLKGGSSLAINQVVGLALGLLTTFLFTRYTSQDTYANFGYVVSLLSVASLAALPGIDTAILYAAAKGDDGALREGTRLRLKSSLLGVGGMLAWAAVLVVLGRNTEATVVAACAPLVMLLYPFAGVFAFLQGKGRFGDYTVANLAVEGGRTAILALAVVVLGIDGAGAILVLFGSMGVFYLIVYLVHSRGLQGEAGPGFVTMGRNLTGTAALATVAGQMDRLLVGTFFPPAAMAVYNLGFTLTDPLRSFGALGAKLLFPQVVRADASAPRFVRKYGLGLLILAGALAALVGLYWVLFPLIQPWMFPGYDGAVAITNWLIVASALSIFTTVESQALWGLSDLRAVYSARIVLPVLRLVLLLVGGYGFGVPGILAAQVLHPALAALIIAGFWLYALYRRTR